MGQAMIGYAWPDALAKAQAAAEIIQQQMAEVGLKAEETVIEYLGYNSIHGPLADPTHADELNEVYLRIAVRCADKREAAKLGRLFPPLGSERPALHRRRGRYDRAARLARHLAHAGPARHHRRIRARERRGVVNYEKTLSRTGPRPFRR